MNSPYGMAELRPVQCVSEDTVRCHVAGCTVEVPRQRQHFRVREEYLCPVHGIYLSPSTFQYRDRYRNLLWCDDEDRHCLRTMESVKRTMERLGRERDEDALGWNVTRAFEREGRLRVLAGLLTGEDHSGLPRGEPQAIYWATDTSGGGRWGRLKQAQGQFEEVPNRGTEPDVALYWPGQHLVFVEAKFCAPNRTTPSAKPEEEDPRPRTYGEHMHFARVFTACYHQIAVRSKLYQLMRLWLLGSWLAEDEDARFHLVNLVRWQDERDVEDRFASRYCCQLPGRHFRRATWESIWDALPASGLSDQSVLTLGGYLANKSCGYDGDGRLQRAFIPREKRPAQP